MRDLLPVLLLATSAIAANYYVAKTGVDSTSADGSSANPWATIRYASTRVSAGDTVLVKPGMYSGQVITGKSGTPGKRVTYKSETKWAAKIDGGSQQYIWRNTANYVNIVDFEVYGTGGVIGILSDGNQVSIIGNHVHDIPMGCANSNGGGGIVFTNYATRDCDMIGNLVHHIGGTVQCERAHALYHAVTGGKIYNNIIHHSTGWGIHLWHAANHILISNNLVFAGLGTGILVGHGDGGSVAGGGDGSRINNNIVINNAGSCLQTGSRNIGANNTFKNNLCAGNGGGVAVKSACPVTGTITRMPTFKNYLASGLGDYHLVAGSVAIDAGVSSDAPTTDFDGRARPSGVALDLGPYEFSSSTPPPPPPPTPSSSSDPSNGETTKVVSLQDTRLLQHQPTTAFPAKEFIDVGLDTTEGSNAVYRSLLGFAAPSGLSASTVQSATLSLNWFYPAASRQADTIIDVFSPSASWNVATATWTNRVDSTAWATAGGSWVDAKGVSMGSAPFATTVIKGSTAATNAFVDLDVTAMVAKIAAGTLANNGFLIKARDESVDNYIAFHSADAADAAKRPKLAITTSSFAPITATGLLDTRMLRHNPTTPFPTKVFLDVGGSTLESTWRSLIKFNIARSTSYTAKSAVLSLFWFYSEVRTADTIIEVYRPATAWDVSTATWNVRQTGTSWGVAGGEWYDRNGVKQGTAPFATLTIAKGTPVKDGFISLEVGSLVSKYVSGAYVNTGFLIKARTELGNYIAFHSAEATDRSTRPKLVIQPGLLNGATTDGSSVVLPAFLTALVGAALACL